MSSEKAPYGQPQYNQQAQPPFSQQPLYNQQVQPPYNQQPYVRPPYPQPTNYQQSYNQPPYTQPPNYQQPYNQPSETGSSQLIPNSFPSYTPPAQPPSAQFPNDQKTNLPPSISPAPTAPPPAYSSPRLLHIYHEGLTQRHASIKDSSKTTLYTIDLHQWTKPHMVIFAGDSKNHVGTVTFHTLSSTMDLVINGTEIGFKNDSFWTQQYSFVSRATGKKLRWKFESSWSMKHVVCLDEKDLAVAKFEGSTWALRKLGKIELVPGVDGGLLDEVLVSGLAMMEMIQRTKKAASATGA
ncbi:MAG: hypothetical protein M1835_007069 [Candelina submexicana]|nr:MAG: hypothetical protein M1835_007069 [Candelina submexicana]